MGDAFNNNFQFITYEPKKSKKMYFLKQPRI